MELPASLLCRVTQPRNNLLYFHLLKTIFICNGLMINIQTVELRLQLARPTFEILRPNVLIRLICSKSCLHRFRSFSFNLTRGASCSFDIVHWYDTFCPILDISKSAQSYADQFVKKLCSSTLSLEVVGIIH